MIIHIKLTDKIEKTVIDLNPTEYNFTKCILKQKIMQSTGGRKKGVSKKTLRFKKEFSKLMVIRV